MVARPSRRAARDRRQGGENLRRRRGQAAREQRSHERHDRQGSARQHRRRGRRAQGGGRGARGRRHGQDRRCAHRSAIHHPGRATRGGEMILRRARRIIAGGGIGLVLPVLLLVLWETVSRTGIAPRNLLPAPSVVFGALWTLAASGELWGHIVITLFRVAMGFFVGTAVATVLGALTGYSQAWRRLIDPMLQALGTIPSMAWVPLFVLWLGIFEASKVTLIAVGAFFPIYLNLMAGIQQVDRKLVEVARVHG